MSRRLTKTTVAMAALLAGALALPGPAAADPGRGWGGPGAERHDDRGGGGPRGEGGYARGWRDGPPAERRDGRDWRTGAGPDWHHHGGRHWDRGAGGPGWRPWHRRPYAPPPPPPPRGTGISVILNGVW